MRNNDSGCEVYAEAWQIAMKAVPKPGSDFETDEECERDKSGGRIYDRRKTEDRI